MSLPLVVNPFPCSVNKHNEWHCMEKVFPKEHHSDSLTPRCTVCAAAVLTMHHNFGVKFSLQ